MQLVLVLLLIVLVIRKQAPFESIRCSARLGASLSYCDRDEIGLLVRVFYLNNIQVCSRLSAKFS